MGTTFHFGRAGVLPRFERAFALYELARVVALRLNDQKLLGKTYYNIARSYSGLRNYESSNSAYLQSKDAFVKAGLPRDVIYILSDLAIISLIQERFDDARTYSEQSLILAERLRNDSAPPGAWPDTFGESVALRILAELSAREGNHGLAIAQMQRALNLLNELNDAATYGYYIAETYATLGRVYTSAGDHQQALAVLTTAVQTATGPQIPNVINSIGYLYLEQEDYAKARMQFERSFNIYHSEKNLREEAKVLLNLAVVEQRQGNYEEALKLFNETLEAAKATELVDIQIAAGEGIGVVLTATRHFDRALVALNQSLKLAVEVKDKMRQTELLWRTAQAYFEMEDYIRATAIAEKALKLARDAHLPKLTYLTLATLGKSYAAQNRSDLAIQTLLASVNTLEALRNQVAGGEQSLQLFFENKLDPYHALVELFVRQTKFTEALTYAERAKGRVLLDAISGSKAELDSVLKDKEKAEKERLLRNISIINDRIKNQENPQSANLAQLYSELDSARVEFQTFQDRTYVAHPELRLRAGSIQPLTASTIKNFAQDNDIAYLEYLVTDKKVGLFIVKRSPTSSESYVQYLELMIKPQDLERKVNQFHDMLAQRHPGHASVGRDLYSALIEPVAQQLREIKTICIVADGFLWNLPFQALTKSTNRYLLEDFAIYYTPSLSLLRDPNGPPERKNLSDSLIAFGNPIVGKNQKLNEDLCPLPEAEKEVAAVGSAFAWSKKKVLVGKEAAERTFKAHASEYASVHFATHGVLDNRDPLYSHLLLTKTEGDVENDGLLEAREIMNIRLPADLAVLSACETGNGRISPGEGVIGMSWAFFVAGARSLVVSQWRVNSESTSQLMRNFYQALARQSDKAESLREASLQLLKDRRYRHPFYWAGFVLVGRN